MHLKIVFVFIFILRLTKSARKNTKMVPILWKAKTLQRTQTSTQSWNALYISWHIRYNNIINHLMITSLIITAYIPTVTVTWKWVISVCVTLPPAVITLTIYSPRLCWWTHESVTDLFCLTNSSRQAMIPMPITRTMLQLDIAV